MNPSPYSTFHTLLCLLMLVGLTACGRNVATHPTATPKPVKHYEVRGVFKEARDEGRKAVIAHDRIPGYMEAMTMTFDVRDTNGLRGLVSGDVIQFRMSVTDDDGWIDQISKIGSTRTTNIAAAVPPPAATPKPWEAELAVGSQMSDFTLTNQWGKTISLADYRGSTLVITFIFTRCPFPVYCPRMNQNFEQVQRTLLAEAPKSAWQLLSISFDPEYDTPERLAAHAKGFNADPARWNFATGTETEIRRMAASLGLAFWKEGASFNHNLRTAVIGSEGKLEALFRNNEWKPSELVETMKKSMAKQR